MGGPGSGRRKGGSIKSSTKALQKKGGIADISKTGAARAKGWRTRKVMKAAINSRKQGN
jgi:hypothetical protein